MAIPSASQSAQSKLLRGQDYDDGETNRALAHRTEQQTISKNKSKMLKALVGNKEKLKALEAKTLPLTHAPSYEEGWS